MPLANTASRYGSVAKFFHWSIAILILANIPLGIVANGLPDATSEQIARKATLFSLHKTLGVSVLVLAVARIGWAVVQPKPANLHPERRAESFLAGLAHWLLYASILLVPLSGLLQHSAATGYAPIWWPLGQSLPFVPKDPDLAQVFAGLHIVFERVLAITLALHIAGALKHHFWDRDDTLRRMLPGRTEAAPAGTAPAPGTPVWASVSAAIAVFVAALFVGRALGVYSEPPALAAAAPLEEVASDWRVTDGEIAIEIRQMGATVEGRFADWTAAIDFSETPVDGRHGSVEVTIAIPSLTLGTVTQQAMQEEYFDAEDHPTAIYTADLLPGEGEGTYRAEGTLTVKGNSVPLSVPFELDIEGDAARAELSATVDRRDFGIGLGQDSDGTLGFEVGIEARVAATRAEAAS